MDSLVQDKIYKRVSVVDNQGFCSDANNPFTAAAPNTRSSWILPSLLKYVLKTFFTILTLASKPMNAWPQDDYIYNDEMFEPEYTDEYEPFDYLPEVISDFTPTSETLVSPNIYIHIMLFKLRPIQEFTTPTPKKQKVFNDPKASSDLKGARRCDLKTDLYALQPERLLQGGQNNPLKVSEFIVNVILEETVKLHFVKKYKKCIYNAVSKYHLYTKCTSTIFKVNRIN